MTDDQVEEDAKTKYPYRYYWHSSSQKSYAGTAIWSVDEPQSVHYGFGDGTEEVVDT
jgi:exonuclease III